MEFPAHFMHPLPPLFKESYRCFSFDNMPRSEERPTLNYSGKIILPQSAFAKLASLNIEYPMLFRLSHGDKFTHSGVLEFTAPEGRMYLPGWMLEQLDVSDGNIIDIQYVSLPLGKFLKIQPQSVDFLDITDPKAVLERALRNFNALTKGDIISLEYNDKIYKILCMEIKPNEKGAISITETDLSVDFAPPLGYVEPPRASSDRDIKSSSYLHKIGVEQHKLKQQTDDGTAKPNFKIEKFTGQGQRLSGKSLNAASPLQHAKKQHKKLEPTSQEVKENESPSESPDTIRLPSNKLWFGYQVEAFKPVDKTTTKSPSSSSGYFLGKGQSLRSKK